MKVQLSQNPDMLGTFQVQNRNQQLKIYKRWLSLAYGKKTMKKTFIDAINGFTIVSVGINLHIITNCAKN
jgi:hypothetical protein